MHRKNTTRAAARGELAEMLAGPPALPAETLDRLVDRADQGDGATFELDGAASTGWTIKAGMVNDAVDVGADDVSTKRSQLWDHCMKMSAHYAAMVEPERPASVRLSSTRGF